MSMIEDIKELGKLGYTKDEINQIIGFNSATVAPVVKEEKEPEQKIEQAVEAKDIKPEATVAGLSLESLGIKLPEKTAEEAPQKTQTEVIDILRQMSSEIASLRQTQQVANTQKPVATIEDISVADIVSAFSEN